MGKSSRKLQKELKKQVPVKKTDDNSHTINVILITVAVVVSLALIALAAYAIIDGIKDRNAKPTDLIAFESKNQKIDNAMFSYFYTSNFYSFYQQNYMYMQDFDPSQPLSQQVYDQSQGMTWHQYFIGMTADNMMSILALAEAADEAGIKLGDDELKAIDDNIAGIESQAAEAGMTKDQYISYLYGDAVTEDTVRKALELTALASKESETLGESFNTTVDECEAYYSENKQSFDKVSFRTYDVVADVTEDMTDEQKQVAYDEAKATAESIAASKSEQEYVEKVYEYMLVKNKTQVSPLEDSQVLENAQTTIVNNHTYGGGELDDWVFDTSRKSGDTDVVSTAEGTFNAVYMVTPPARDEYALRSVRHILINTSNYDGIEAADAKRDELQAAWDASDKTEEAFEKLAEEYNEDSNSLYENIKKGDMVAEFENWCFDESRKPGDCEMVTTEYGYHLIYFVETGLPAWESDARNAIDSTKLQEAVEGFVEKYDIKYNTDNLNRIKDYNAYQAYIDTTAADTTATVPEITADTADTAADTADTEIGTDTAA